VLLCGLLMDKTYGLSLTDAGGFDIEVAERTRGYRWAETSGIEEVRGCCRKASRTTRGMEWMACVGELENVSVAPVSERWLEESKRGNLKPGYT
jgi:hypothetical protein